TTDAANAEERNDETALELPERDAMSSLLSGTPLLGGALLDPGQTLGGTPADGATDPSAGISGAMDNVGSLAHTAQQSGPGADAQNINSDGSISSATTPPPDPTT